MALKTVTHVFSIFMTAPAASDAAKSRAVDATRREINSPYIRERLTLGEMYGYLNKRPLTDDPDNPPAFRVTAISIDDNGNVTFTAEILNTATGEAMSDLEFRGVGGYVWSPRNGLGVPDFTRLNGIDYEKTPQYPLV